MINKTYSFTLGTVIDPEEVNQNFDDVLDHIKGEHHRDEDGSPIEPADIATGWGLVPSNGIIIWHGSIATIPSGYVFCNGENSTPDMRNKFILCAGQDSGGTYDVGDTGGSATINIAHTHTGPSHTHTQPAHTHGINFYSSDAANIGVGNWPRGRSDGNSDISHEHLIQGNTGSEGGHDTGAGGTGNTSSALSASQSILPPFIAKAFIMLNL